MIKLKYQKLERSSNSLVISASFIFVALFLALSIAWSLQLFFDMEPCELCLIERIPYYVSLIILFFIEFGYKVRCKESILYFGMVFVALLLLITSGISAYHAGVEWKLWLGPNSCSGSTPILSDSSINLLDQLKSTKLVRCDVPPFVLFGLSLAGWNVLFSLFLAFVALKSRSIVNLFK